MIILKQILRAICPKKWAEKSGGEVSLLSRRIPPLPMVASTNKEGSQPYPRPRREGSQDLDFRLRSEQHEIMG